MTTLAYGAFHATDAWGMFAEFLPLFIRLIVPALVAYSLCSLIAELPNAFFVGPLLYLIFLLVMLPSFSVMGEWGPAHVAMDHGLPLYPILLLTLIIKAVHLSNRPHRPIQTPPSPG